MNTIREQLNKAKYFVCQQLIALSTYISKKWSVLMSIRHSWVNKTLSSLSDQLRHSWVTICITFIIAIATVCIANQYNALTEQKYDMQLFKYFYDSEKKAIALNSGETFAPVFVKWQVPYAGATTTGWVKNQLMIKDIIMSITSGNHDGANPGFFFEHGAGYIRCNILDRFGIDESLVLGGFPIGVETTFVTKGKPELGYRTSMDLIWLRGFDDNNLEVNVLPNVDPQYLKDQLRKGNNAIQKTLQIDKYDQNYKYIGDDGNCSQQGEMFLLEAI
jgi:hypothetical protein